MAALVTVGETPLRLSPPGSRRLETAPELELHADGTASSVAVAAAALGAEATWISKLPETPAGRRIVSQLAQHRVDAAVTWVPADAGRVGLTYHEAATSPRPSGTWQDRGNTTAAALTPGDLPMDVVRGASVLLADASTAALSATARETVEAALRAGRGAGATTALDLDYQPGLTDPATLGETVAGLVDHVDVLFANEDAVRRLLDLSGNPRELANSLVADHGLEMVVITRNEYGAIVLADSPGTNVIHEREAVETDPVDSSGQHTAFVGGYLGRLLDGADPAEALEYGVALGALARTVPGPLVSVERDTVDDVAADVAATSR
jgi:2-dehydro-3-deoxygluconokinase